ncbi:MAG: hypothetical protein AAFP93_00765 [Bacteroidota bacterium]
MQRYLHAFCYACYALLLVGMQLACGSSPVNSPPNSSKLSNVGDPRTDFTPPTVTNQELRQLVSEIDVDRRAQELIDQGMKEDKYSMKDCLTTINKFLISIANGQELSKIAGLSSPTPLTILEAAARYGYPSKVIQALLDRGAEITAMAVNQAAERQDNKVIIQIIGQLDTNSAKISTDSFAKLLTVPDKELVKLVVSKADVKHLDLALVAAKSQLPAVALVMKNNAIDDATTAEIIQALFAAGAQKNFSSGSYFQVWHNSNGKKAPNLKVLDALLSQPQIPPFTDEDVKEVLVPILKKTDGKKTARKPRSRKGAFVSKSPRSSANRYGSNSPNRLGVSVSSKARRYSDPTSRRISPRLSPSPSPRAKKGNTSNDSPRKSPNRLQKNPWVTAAVRIISSRKVTKEQLLTSMEVAVTPIKKAARRLSKPSSVQNALRKSPLGIAYGLGITQCNMWKPVEEALKGIGIERKDIIGAK